MKEKETLIAKTICVFVCLLMIINISNTNALPVIGSIIGVDNMNIGFNYQNNELDMNIPVVKYKKDLDDILNDDIEEFSTTILNDFFTDYNDLNHQSVKMNYDVIKDTNEWFTLKIDVTEEMASSNNFFKYYHIDKEKDKLINLSDLFKDKKYKEEIELEIKRQIMLKDNSSEYNEKIEICDNQNFYFNDDDNIVIVFNKYEIGPGSIGVQEFVIDKDLYSKYLND